MRYFITQRNRETNKFEIMTLNGQTVWFTDKQKVIDKLENIVKNEGSNNVMLLEEISFDTNLFLNNK